jgi:F420-dependent oxidoreductase-like protein
MDFRIFTEPQNGGTYDDQLALAQAAERLGFDAFFRSDHFLAMGTDPGPGPTESWVTLAGLARETSRIRLGTLVSSATFRHPAILAIQVAQVDAMSGGRIELGLGTGWFEEEHAAYGIPFPAKRFGMLEEQLEVVTGLWSTPASETFTYEGEHYRLENSPALPKPVQERVPIIVGGTGPKRTPALAARFADEFNCFVNTAEVLTERRERVRRACEAAGRDPDTMIFSLAAPTAVGPTDAVAESRAEASNSTLARYRQIGVAGTTDEAVDRIATLRELGFTRIYFQLMDQRDLDHVDFIAREVLPRLD